MEKGNSGHEINERSSSEGSETYVDSDCELSAFLHDSRKVPLRQRLILRLSKPPWRSSKCLQVIYRLCLALLPSYISRRIVGGPPPPKKLYPTSALDGLRGFACYFVFNFHLLFTYSTRCEYGYGMGEDPENTWFHQLPFFRLIYAGPAMVAIFFVISGYVLSHKPLKLIHKRSFDQVLHTVWSSVFRRALRLYLPTIIGTFTTMLLLRFGMFKHATKVMDDGKTVTGHPEEHPIYLDTFQLQFWDWYESVLQVTNPWTWGPFYNHYDPHLWTIPFEFRSSIVLFVTIVGLAKVRTPFRLALLSFLIWYCIYSDRWEVTLFLAGMFLADLDLLTGTFDEPPSLDHASHVRVDNATNDDDDDDDDDTNEKPTTTAAAIIPFPRLHFRLGRRRLRLLRRALWIITFILGLYFSSCPNIGVERTPGYRYLHSLIPDRYSPKYRFWQSVGAVLVVFSINQSRRRGGDGVTVIQRLFTNPLAQYLGSISYAFYIVHGPILHSLGYVMMQKAWSVTGQETTKMYCLGFFMGWCVIMPTVLWTADLFWRFVDVPCVRFARWVESKVGL